MNKKVKRVAGVILLFCGISILSIFAYMKISRELYLRKLLRENIVLEIPRLDIKVPVLEGTDSKSLEVAAGHFIGTGSVGYGNYCIAGHNSTIYAEIFNDLDKIELGDKMYLYDKDDNRTRYTYTVTEYKVIEPNEIGILNDYGDDRLTIVSCTDDGKYRQVVVGIKNENQPK